MNIIELIMQKEMKHHNISLGEIATKAVISIPATMSIIQASELMAKKSFRRLPITDSGSHKVLGIVTATDIMNFMGGGDKFNLVTGKHKGNMISALNDSIRGIMTSNVITVKESDKLGTAADIIVNKRCGGLPIVDNDGRIRGIVTERDLLKVYADVVTGIRAGDIMTKNPYVTSPDASIESVSKEMIRMKFRRLPVVSEDVLYGIVTTMDILKYVGGGAIFRDITTGNSSDIMQKPVRELVTRSLYTASPDDDIEYIAGEMLSKGIGAFPVIENSRLVGVITEFDLVKAIYTEHLSS